MTTQSLSTPYENIIGGRRDQALPVLGEADLLRIARLTILVVPPLIPLIHGDLRMSETEVGILAGLPVALFAAIRFSNPAPAGAPALKSAGTAPCLDPRDL
jgi:hypothetical protein